MRQVGQGTHTHTHHKARQGKEGKVRLDVGEG